MDLSTLISVSGRLQLSAEESKIPWDEPAFSQRMLENHLSQEHDWASRRQTVIEQQVAWIASQLPAGARVLDLGCGPGFYTHRLAERGFRCTGVDFSPASIEWARQQAQAADLNIDYIHQDIRNYRPDAPFDFIMMTFGELNVFSDNDAQSLISGCAQWLKPDGKLLIELHTFDEVKRQGMAPASWQRCPNGLFLAVPHLLLTENAWDEDGKISSTQFWAIDERCRITRFGSQMMAWRDADFACLIGNAGLSVVQCLDSNEWPVGETFEGKLFALLAEKSKSPQVGPLNMSFEME
ncbi:class I SAM-dependent methyltransferase [Salmonella enterica]|nr:class I SAM-dependent methyltransferase [Salmonella enterica subsp. enterica serovar Bredeney]EAO6765248.1 class I SAM-dependent methyltransferase [Salmonella enterica]EBU7716629.1 class I SAM-dependent methyltransferase [Salmonella enterica subsp. enterica serovar Thompson]ECB3311027.1 class I SAM-dependent methyltransferase [Salmonella enterica subsp. enterica serovar Mikawasima]ECD3275891.1 class I SAM-dependent methyltransferase [Salmonella enterica subsp. enterica serovar Newport]ECU97